MYAWDSSGRSRRNIHNDSRQVIEKNQQVHWEKNCGSQKLRSRSFSCINQKIPEHRQSRVWEDESSWKDYLLCRYCNIRAPGCNSRSFFFWGTHHRHYSNRGAPIFPSKIGTDAKVRLFTTKRRKKCGVCLRASHAIAQLYTFMIVGLL